MKKLILIMMIVSILISPALSISLVSAEEPLYINLIPLSDEYRRLPVKIYWMDSTECSKDFNILIRQTVDTVILLLRKSIYRFMEENDGLFDELVKLRIEHADDLNEAQVVITGKQLEEGILGETWMYLSDEKTILRSRVYYDCDVVLDPFISAFNVVLHELLHSLGLGHTNFDKVNDTEEVMYHIIPSKRSSIYVSTLDLYLLYMLWFKNYKSNIFYLSDLPLQFKEVRPYVVEFEDLKKAYTELHEKYGVLEISVDRLSEDLYKFKTDSDIKFKVIMEDVKNVENAIEDLSLNISRVKQDISDLSVKVSVLENMENNLRENIKRIEENFILLEEKVLEIDKKIVDNYMQLHDEIGYLDNQLKMLQIISLIIVIVFSMIFIVILLLARRWSYIRG